MKTTYHAIGSVRGSCGHTHLTPESAARCAQRDSRACHRLGGGAYSDRGVERIDGQAMTIAECEAADSITHPA